MVCNTIAKPLDGQIPLRILNATSEEITLWKGTVIGIAEPVYTCNQFNADALDDLEYGCICEGEGEWKCTCTEMERERNVVEQYDFVMAMSVDELEDEAVAFESDTSIPSHVKQLYLESLPHLQSNQQKNRLANILTNYEDCFAKNSDDIGVLT